MPERVRFAPSPTGPLHIGGLRTALFNYLYAKHHGGTFILRIEDTDQARYVDASEAYIYQALDWLNLPLDEGPKEGGAYGPYRQSERKALYAKHVEHLLKNGTAYYAFDTPEALEQAREKADAVGGVFQYGKNSRLSMQNSLSCSAEETQMLLKKGDYVVRLKIEAEKPFVIKDLLRGTITIDPATLDDKILMKSDGMPTYHFANVVDDHLMKISTVIRGEEWLPSLPLHFLLYQAFGWQPPAFVHLPLLLKPQGKGKLSKRDGISGGFPVFPMAWEDLDGFKERGVLPEALRNYLLLLGWNSGNEKELFGREEMIETFGVEGLQKGGARFDFAKAVWMNEQYIQMMSLVSLKNALADYLAPLSERYDEEAIEKITALIQPRIKLLTDAEKELRVFASDPLTFDEKPLQKVLSKLPATFMPWCIEKINATGLVDFKAAVMDWAEKHSCGLGVLMQSLRLALVGDLSGPDLIEIMNLLKKDVTLKRIGFFIQHNNL